MGLVSAKNEWNFSIFWLCLPLNPNSEAGAAVLRQRIGAQGFAPPRQYYKLIQPSSAQSPEHPTAAQSHPLPFRSSGSFFCGSFFARQFAGNRHHDSSGRGPLIMFWIRAGLSHVETDATAANCAGFGNIPAVGWVVGQDLARRPPVRPCGVVSGAWIMSYASGQF